MRGLGTLLNLAAIGAGASVGALLGDRLPERLRETLVAALGLFTLALGVQQALASFGDDLARAMGRSAPLLVLGALLAGGLAGEAARLEGRLERLGEAVKRRLGGQAAFVEGFVLASWSPVSARWPCWAPLPTAFVAILACWRSSRCWTASPCSPSPPRWAGAWPPRA
jgi:uncharacterized protein